MRRVKFALLLMESGLSQKEICQKLNWRPEKLTRFVRGQRYPTDDDIGEMAMVLGKSMFEIRSALDWKPDIPKFNRACPWCQKMISIIAEDTVYETWNNIPTNCPSCRKAIEVGSEESDIDRDIIWWLKRGE